MGIRKFYLRACENKGKFKVERLEPVNGYLQTTPTFTSALVCFQRHLYGYRLHTLWQTIFGF